MRVNGTLYYVLKDHLGSASVVTDNSGNVVGDQRYYPFGETRLNTGTLYTDKLFTGLREMASLGIYHYGARFYSPKLGRFLSADTIVPNPFHPQDYNRFAYVRNNPVRYVDPTGHICVQNGGGVDNEFGIPGNCNGGEKANYQNPFPGGVPTVNKPGKPKGGGDDLEIPTIDPPTADANLGGSKPEPSVDPTPTQSSQSTCLLDGTWLPDYLCVLPTDVQTQLGNGNTYPVTQTAENLCVVYCTSAVLLPYLEGGILVAAVGPELAVPVGIALGAPQAYAVLRLNLDRPPGGAVGDVFVTVNQISDETTTLYGYTVPTYNQVSYIFRNEELIFIQYSLNPLSGWP